MDIREFLSRLHIEHHNSASGEYTCRCPAHDDRTASLTVNVQPSRYNGAPRIVFKCHAGCSEADVLKAMGLKVQDLRDDNTPPNGGAPHGMTVHQAVPRPTKVESGKAEKKPLKPLPPITKIYSYVDVNGHELFQVTRHDYIGDDGKHAKTFRQRMYAPNDKNAKKDGYVWSVPDNIKLHTLYRLPEVKDAIRDGRTVYIVEGEKDADTLARLGYVATTQPQGAGKWADSYSELLRGAHVVMLPDADTAENGYIGQEHGWKVCTSLSHIAKTIKMVNLKACCPELPDKGDITDMVELMGDRPAMDALARQIGETLPFDPCGVKFWLNARERAEQLFARIPGYCASNGCICRVAADGGKKPICDFVAIPYSEIMQDDGVNRNMAFELDAWTQDGRKLPRTRVCASDFGGMGWVTGAWGLQANVMPGNSAKDHARYVIAAVGKMTAAHITEYSHTGWRKINGKWCYLYHGGAVGAEGVRVHLDGGLNGYRLDGENASFDAIPLTAATAASWSLRGVIAPHIAIPLLGTIYLAPLWEFLNQTNIKPSYGLYLAGGTGSRKSTSAALALSHFGNFTSKTLPASFHDTANTIRRRAFILKDMPYVVDDYHPSGSQQEKRQLKEIAQSLSRMAGDGAERGRMRPDGSLQPATPPRCVTIITGEDIPDVGESGLARYYMVSIQPNDIPIGPELTAAQEMARNGLLRRAMLGYIDWLREQADDLPETLHKQFLDMRTWATNQNQAANQHARAPETIAHILTGYHMMLRYFQHVGLLNQEASTEALQEAMATLTETSKEQARIIKEDKPVNIFLESVAELLASKEIYAMDINPESAQDGKVVSAARELVGYKDHSYYYFIPRIIYKCVQELCIKQGSVFPITLRSLYRDLRTAGILRSGINCTEERPTKSKRIGDNSVFYLWIPRNAIDGTDENEKQMQMNFTQVESGELPSEWT